MKIDVLVNKLQNIGIARNWFGNAIPPYDVIYAGDDRDIDKGRKNITILLSKFQLHGTINHKTGHMNSGITMVDYLMEVMNHDITDLKGDFKILFYEYEHNSKRVWKLVKEVDCLAILVTLKQV